MQAFFNAAVDHIGSHGPMAGHRTRAIHRASVLLTSNTRTPIASGIIPRRPCRDAKKMKFVLSWYPNANKEAMSTGTILDCSKVFRVDVTTADGVTLPGRMAPAFGQMKRELRDQGASPGCYASLPTVSEQTREYKRVTLRTS